VRRYRSRLRGLAGLVLPYSDEEVEHSSCYVMPLTLEDPGLQTPLRELLLERFGVQTSLLYPAVHEFTAYAQAQSQPLPRSELAARSQVTIPLYPHLTEEDQDRVIAGVTEGLSELSALRARTSPSRLGRARA
jgi:dTDP-4-amino-4,6-dideoxygalactose transaminase